MLYKNKYRSKSLRLKDWDYSSAGWYYVTICTNGKKKYFGEVVNGKIILNDLGNIVKKFLTEIPHHFSNVFIDLFVVMPNHIHVIIIIENNGRDVACNVSINRMSIISLRPRSLSSIVRSYKSAVTRYVRNNIDEKFTWQQRYYEHIIRNEKSLYEIRKYIKLNPLKWEIDKENPINN